MQTCLKKVGIKTDKKVSVKEAADPWPVHNVFGGKEAVGFGDLRKEYKKGFDKFVLWDIFMD